MIDKGDAELPRLFREQFGDGPDIETARATGRVNLIGEHLDYNGLAVMPMCIDRHLTVHFRPRRDDRIRLVNVDGFHPPIDFPLSMNRAGVAAAGWDALVRAAARSLGDRYGDLQGLDGIVGSNLPIGAGLSSSTALVVAVARALISVNRIDIGPLALIECLAQAERTVGAPGGAMDHAACIAGRSRTALKVEFDPLRLTEIAVPGDWRFVIADSLVPADKKGLLRESCSRRINECRQILEVFQAAGVRGSESHVSLLGAWDREELSTLSARLLSSTLFRRHRHVLTESRRVERAEQAMREGDAVTFGRLMTESHTSLCEDFEVSHPSLDRLVALSLANGALGARLTGAGFGGSVVAFCDGSAGRLIDALRRAFYSENTLERVDGGVLFQA